MISVIIPTYNEEAHISTTMIGKPGKGSFPWIQEKMDLYDDAACIQNEAKGKN